MKKTLLMTFLMSCCVPSKGMSSNKIFVSVSEDQKPIVPALPSAATSSDKSKRAVAWCEKHLPYEILSEYPSSNAIPTKTLKALISALTRGFKSKGSKEEQNTYRMLLEALTFAEASGTSSIKNRLYKNSDTK